MKFEFFKYQGTGNDFIVIDDRQERFPLDNVEAIAGLCHRRFGIGADGLILLRNHKEYDFEMVYFNADGRPSSMCGNGGRCIAAFARFLGIGLDKVSFLAVDGPHVALFKDELVSLQMKDVSDIAARATAYVLNTGSPHFVLFQEDIDTLNVMKLARAIRYNAEFEREGINVNFVEVLGDNYLKVRTYERGVEDETYSCGTGVVGSAITYAHAFSSKTSEENKDKTTVAIRTLGGDLEVSFQRTDGGSYTDVWLTGPAAQVFIGELKVGE